MRSNQVATPIHSPVTAEEAAHMTASWPDLLRSQIQTEEQAAQIQAALKRLTVPATRQWIAGRVATVLGQYFASSVPSEMMIAIAEDWNEELRKYPAWAIQNACRWWMSESNQDRRKKPLTGDIAARAKVEMGVVRLAEGALSRFGSGAAAQPVGEQDEPCSADAAEAIMREAGFRPKRFGGGA